MGDVVDDVVDVITAPIEWIGDVVSDVGEWAVDEIVDPVFDAVDDVIDAVEDDPVKAIATVAAVATGNAWAIPLIEGADVAQNGGDIGDILEATAKAYVAQQVGSYAGQYAGEAAAAAGTGETAATILGTASGQAASAAVLGEDPVQAFITGGIKAGVQAGLGYIDEKLTEATQGDGTDTGGGTGTGGGTTVGDAVGDAADAVSDATSFLDEYPTVKNVLADSLEAALTGKDITGDVVMGAVLKGKITAETVKTYLDTDSSLSESELAALTTTIQNVTNATFSGADVSDTLYGSINAYGKQELNKIIDKSVKNTIDKVRGTYQEVEATATKLDEENANYTAIAQRYNGYVAELDRRIGIRDGKLATVNNLREQLKAASGYTDSAGEDRYRSILADYNAAVNDFNAYSQQTDAYYSQTFKPSTDTLKAELDTKATLITNLTNQYETQKDSLISAGDQLDDELVPVADAVQNTFVRAMTGDEFNAAEYRAVNGLGDMSDADTAYHWLTTGKDQNLPVNQAQYNKELDNALVSSMTGTLEALGLNVTDLSPDQLKFLREQTLSYGNGNLQSVRDIENGSAALATTLRDKLAQDVVGSVSDEAMAEIVADYPVLEGVDLSKVDFDDLPDGAKVQLAADSVVNNETQTITKSEGVSTEDILTGKAVAVPNAQGLLNWEDATLRYDVPKWDSSLGMVVREVPHPSMSGATTMVDVQGRYIGTDGQVVSTPIPKITITGVSFGDLKDENAGSYLDILAEATPDEVKAAVNAGVQGLQQQYEFAKNVASYVANTETAQNIANSDFGQNTAGVVLDAGGELLDAFNNLVLIANINPESTPLGQTARDMMTLAGDFKTDEYQEAAARISNTIGNANIGEDGKLLTNPDGTPLSTAAKVWNTIKAVGGAALEDPGVFASEYIAKELLQEVPVLLASGGTGNVIKAGLKEAGNGFAQEIGRRTALGTAAVLDVSESFGGTAGGAYDDALNEALNSGMELSAAQEYAKDIAINAGAIAAVTTLSTMGIGGNKFEQAIFSGKKGKNFSEAFDVVTKEAAQETVEEGLPTAYVESQLYQLNPDRDVVGNVTANSLLGAISGGGTSGGIYSGAATGDFLSNALILFNSDVQNVIQTAPDLGVDAAQQQLAGLGLTDTTLQTNILNQAFDADFVSTGEAYQGVIDYTSNNNIPYSFSATELNNFTGSTPEADLNSAIDAYVDPRYVDAGEVAAAAKLEGYTLTDDQVSQYVGQADQESVVADIRDEFDPQAVTTDEATQFFADLGYEPTQDEINQFVAQINESEQQQAVGEYVDPLMTSTEEATEFLTALGYEPSEEEIAQFVGQYGEEAQQAAIEKYVDPRLVTEEEVLNAFQVAGLPDVRPEDIPPLAGQYPEADLLGKLQEALPDAQFNVLKYMIGKPPTAENEATGIYAQLEDLQASGLDQDQALEQILSDLQSTGEDITGVTDQVNTIANVIGKPATEVTDADIDFIADIIAQTEVAGGVDQFNFTQNQLAYDVTGDGIVDINDQNLLNDAIQGQDVAFATESKFQPATGIFAQLEQQAEAQTQLQQQIDAQNALAVEQQQQLAQQVEDEAVKSRRLGNLKDLRNMAIQDASRITTVNPQPVAKIGPAYDFGSIFRDAGQESFYKSPYAQGGMIETNEELLRLIGGK